MIRVLLRPLHPVYREWLSKAIDFVREVYRDEYLEPLNIIAFGSRQTYEAEEALEKLVGDILDAKTIQAIVEGISAVYVRPARVVVVPLVLPPHLVPIYWHTETFFHEVTHHALANSRKAVLAADLLGYLPSIADLLSRLPWEKLSRLLEAYASFVDELFAHYAEVCYLRKLSKSPCDVAQALERAGSYKAARGKLLKLATSLGARRVEDEIEELPRRASSDLHNYFVKLVTRFPVDVYEARKDFYEPIFEGRELVLQGMGDP